MRQHQVLAEYFAHHNVKEAAHCLNMSEQTFKNHITAVYRKTGSTCASEALSKLGWLAIPETHKCRHEATKVVEFMSMDEYLKEEILKLRSLINAMVKVTGTWTEAPRQRHGS